MALLVFAATIPSGAPARAQSPEPVRLRSASFAGGEAVDLILPWLYHPGDDPRWASPALDDRGWEPVRTGLEAGALPSAGWPGSGWFRRHLRVEPDVGTEPLTLRIESHGISEVYLDGLPLLVPPEPAPNPLTGRGAGSGAWTTATLAPGIEHVLAVRHRSRPGAVGAAGRGFLVTLERVNGAAAKRASDHRRIALQAIAIAVPLFLALLHFALFGSYPKARENLFYACSMISFAGIALCDLGLIEDRNPAWFALSRRISDPFALATVFFVLLTYYAVRTRPMERNWRYFALLGAGVALVDLLWPSPWQDRWKYLFLALTAAEVLRVEIFGRKVEREGVRVLLYGLLLLNAAAFLQVFVDLRVFREVAGVRAVYLVGALAFAVSMSIFLARSFARTSLHLERRLDENRALAEQVLTQERAAYEAELRRQRLEAANERQTAEIEAARALQISMLPKSLPEVAGLETAAAMVTASEVGGDYYDFRVAADGSLVVAFGDATGHGVAAGIMVTAIKALFSSLEGDERLPDVLAECDRVLRRMNVKPFHMCLTLARITPRSITVCQAAMPPVLVYRALGGRVEELGLGGLPVGSKLPGRWRETKVDLAPGDAVLFASDGFPELLNRDDQELGFEAARESFRAAAGATGATPQSVLDGLSQSTAAWRGERDPEDDMTFVVVRATVD